MLLTKIKSNPPPTAVAAALPTFWHTYPAALYNKNISYLKATLDGRGQKFQWPQGPW